MKLDDDFDNGGGGGGASLINMALAVSAFILIIIGIVFFYNRINSNSSNGYKKLKMEQANLAEAENEELLQDTVKKDRLTADDLDIWDMYPEDEEPEEYDEGNVASVTPTPEVSPVSEEEKYNDGKHFKIELSDGSREWIKIDTERKKNNYDFTDLVKSDGKAKYYSDGKQVSFLGIDVSRYQKNIDFNQVKNAGIQFVMIRVGARGYQTGQLSIDEYFEQNIQKAIAAGLDVGVYFYSQAISAAEANEEAAVVIQALTNYKLTYPVAYDMELVPNDVSRVDTLSRDERTVIAATFINAMTSAGYKTLLYGNEEWLVKKIDLKKLPTVSVWLADEEDFSDYPYQYSMWQYTTQGSVSGVVGDVNMDISFIDYSAQ